MSADDSAIPAQGSARVAHFLAEARKQRFRSTDAAAAAVRVVGRRTIQKYEDPKADQSRIPTARKAKYARLIAGWSEADLVAIYDGQDPPPIRPQVGAPPPRRDVPEGLAVTTEAQAHAISRVWTWTDLPIEMRKYMTELLADIPVVDPAQQQPDPGAENDSSAHAG